jgi:hypothetical protein
MDFKPQKSFVIGLLNGRINVPELIKKNDFTWIVRNGRGKELFRTSLPIYKTMQTGQVHGKKFDFSHVFERKTKVKRIDLYLGEHLCGVNDEGFTYLKGDTLKIEIENHHPILRVTE